MPKAYRRAIVWLRRDLRLRDNVALGAAAEASDAVIAAFVLDPVLLASERIGAPLVQAFFDALSALRAELRESGSDLALLEGRCETELAAFAVRAGAQAVFYNRDYEPQAIERDERASAYLRERGIHVHAHLDHVVFGSGEIPTASGEAYRVYTPYARRWRERYALEPRVQVDSLRAVRRSLVPSGEIGMTREVPAPEEYGFARVAAMEPCSERTAHAALERFFAGRAQRYSRDRDFPAVDGTSKLSIHLRAGTIGIRTCVDRALAAGAEKWLQELIWREFYQMILHAFPRVAEGPFIEAAARIPWNDDEAGFAAWCEGRTGYPIVDAAMRQLNATGWMHNRLRMIAASFLTKDLLIDWRRGERYFEQHLADADLAQNNGGWQWAASTGTDAVPYFRIFNPVLQSRAFDPDGTFIRQMIPELAHLPAQVIHAPWEDGALLPGSYPPPVVEHRFARSRALAAYEPVLAHRSKGDATR